MNNSITLLYLHVLGKSDPSAPDPAYYEHFSERFVETYKEFPPGIEHNLVVVCCGGSTDLSTLDLFPEKTSFLRYFGGGWDIGAQQFGAKAMESDWVVCMSTPVYFHRAGWLARMAEAWTQFGDGLYGPQASYEHNPHIRTSCYALKPERMRQYPHLIDTREKCRWFESTDWNFTRWFIDQGLPVKMVTWSGIYDVGDWRKPDNVFRKGDQSDLLALDRHNDVYFHAHDEDRAVLTAMADGK